MSEPKKTVRELIANPNLQLVEHANGRITLATRDKQELTAYLRKQGVEMNEPVVLIPACDLEKILNEIRELREMMAAVAA